ncbi:hypothetical protein Goarm_014411 [Gossypium armourianum]|uniref:MAR-binding filament-like protein 1-1 n=1 Tax=Gossypium armourianum TaxID=34283 RepID=A0A7J9J6V5_9ROSI|nr:hypothetical protein [Gossypium armourianum]
MGFMIGSSCYLQNPISNSQVRFPSSLSVSFNIRNGETKRKRRKKRNFRPPMACLTHEDPNDDVSGKRRAVLLVGISILPLLQLRSQALEISTLRRERPRKSKSLEEGTRELPTEVATEESDVNKPEESQIAVFELNKPEESRKLEESWGDSRSNPFLSLLNGLGVLGASVLGALYALVQKEKNTNNEILESFAINLAFIGKMQIKIELQEKEVAIIMMEKDFESKLLIEREERTKQLKEAKEEQLALRDQLNSANSTITGLGCELNNEKRLIEKLKVQIDSLQNNLSEVREEKRSLKQELKEKLNSVDVLREKVNLLGSELNDKEVSIQKLSTLLAGKESEFKNLITTYKQTEEELGKAHLEIERLKEELQRSRSELESESSLVDELNARVSSLLVERDNSMREFLSLQEEYNDLKLSSENKAVADAKLLGERENEIRLLKEKLELALNDVSENKTIAADLNKEKESLERALEMELHGGKNLKEELLLVEETLSKSRSEVSYLSEQLKQSRIHCKELESDVSRVTTKFYEAKERLQANLDEAKQNGVVLAGELTTTKELLKKTLEERQTFSRELTSMTENRNTLQRELIDAYKRVEAISSDLKEEKTHVSSLNQERQALENQIVKDKEARKSLKTNLEEATNSLDEVNQKILKLSRDLEIANAKISSLEDEKMVLYKTLTEQKNASKEARENMEDAHSIVMTLNKERESLEKRVKKLEEELASAKGEILRLRSRINSSKAPVNDQPQQKDETETKVTVSARKSRRKKGSSQ